MKKNNKPILWNPLDNAAKIFPSASNHKDTKVFRFACQLKETIDENILQNSVNKTLEQFPHFSFILKRGAFWYYLETSDIKPKVKKENTYPCRQLYNKNAKNLLFEVTYYNKRINLEVYHAITDGTGALQFFKTLIINYLSEKYYDELKDKDLSIDYDASFTEKMDDSFKKYYEKSKMKISEKKIKTFRIKGAKYTENRLSIIEGIVSLKELLALSHSYNVTITVFLCSVFMMSIKETMAKRDLKKSVVITVPVNLRKYFSSESARNFFSVVNVDYIFSENTSFEEVLSYVSNFFKTRLTKEELSKRVNSLGAIENNFFARITPLPIKDIVLKAAHDISELQSTAALSNIGNIIMPEHVHKYIQLFDVFVSTKKIQICMCTFSDNVTLSFSTPYISADIQKNFFRMLSSFGLNISIYSNDMEGTQK